ncbi:hypothetical protein WDW37_12250 [Bdellovibrionota bacterium FG-1]
MSKKRSNLNRFALLALPLFLSCASNVDFTSPTPIPSGIVGKSWQTPYFVDDGLYTPLVLTPSAALWSFDAALSDNTLQVAATWHDANETVYRGYGRLYAESTGWSTAASAHFTQIATDGSTDLRAVTLASAAGGIFAAQFFGGTNTDGVSALYNTTYWHTYSAVSLSTIPTITAASNLIQGPRAVSTLDAQKRGYVFFIGGDNSGDVYGTTWQSTNDQGIATSLQNISNGAAAPASGVTTLFDGSTRVCVTYELSSTSLLYAKCFDASQATLPNLGATSAAQISAARVAGHETATDEAGNIMAVFYQLVGNEYHLFSNLASSGTWAASTTQVDSGMDAGYSAPSPSTSGTAIAGARPGVAHVGAGRFLAVWVGINTTASPMLTQLYSSLYTPGSGWSTASAISGTQEPYASTPHPQGLHVFGNGHDNAGFALNKIYTSQAIGSVAASTPDIYPESAQVRVTQIGRWQTLQGWLPVTTVGNYCYTTGSGSFPTNIAQTDASCNQRPKGLMFTDGNSLVFYPDRDNNTSATSNGNRRLAVIEFK